MAYITVGQARARSQRQWLNSRIAEAEIRKSASTPGSTMFDIFLSHSFEDAEVIAGIKGLIEDQGLRVYVDWIDDPQADRSNVTAATADMLRQRMNHCQSLLYASSNAATNSKWMPWELGYFDGKKPDHVAIVPIVKWEGAPFLGQEYLGLYPHVELLNVDGLRRLGQYVGRYSIRTLRSAIQESFRC
jgi:hypothetical protein